MRFTFSVGPTLMSLASILAVVSPATTVTAQPAPMLEFLFNETGNSATNSVFVPMNSPGDFNSDSQVDAADYVVWRKNGGSVEDYETWQFNFGNGLSGTASLPMMQWDGATWIPADNHGPDGSGASGLPGDRAYYDPSIMLDPGQTPGGSNSHYFGGFAGGFNVPEAQDLPALTVQGWFKPPAGNMVGNSPGSFGSLIGNLGSSANDGGWTVRTRNSAQAGTLELRFGEEEFAENHFSVGSTAGVYSEIDQWVFFAVTLNASTGDVEFFKGTDSLTVESAGFGSSGPLIDGVIANSNRNFYIGNSNAEGAQWSQGRAFDGQLDNLRVFDSVLSMTELEELRQLDLAPALAAGSEPGAHSNMPGALVPEPTSLVLCCYLLAIAFARRKR